jgi:hypothetical protein
MVCALTVFLSKYSLVAKDKIKGASKDFLASRDSFYR